MKYVNAKAILPDALLKELQDYIQGGYIYVPSSHKQRKRWGELSGYRIELHQRNCKILQEYSNGFTIEYLANKYCLSVYTIRKIIYQK